MMFYYVALLYFDLNLENLPYLRQYGNELLREKESYMVKVGKQDTFKKYYQLNKIKLNKQKDIKNKISINKSVELCWSFKEGFNL